jgi:phospholipase C
MLVISPYARRNCVDHTVTDQTSIIRFIEDNWLGGQRIGNGSFDSLAGSLNTMFDFRNPTNRGMYVLDPTTGEVAADWRGGNW